MLISCFAEVSLKLHGNYFIVQVGRLMRCSKLRRKMWLEVMHEQQYEDTINSAAQHYAFYKPFPTELTMLSPSFQTTAFVKLQQKCFAYVLFLF